MEYLKYDFVKEGLATHIVADNKFAIKLLSWAPKRSLFDMCNDSISNKKNL